MHKTHGVIVIGVESAEQSAVRGACNAGAGCARVDQRPLEGRCIPLGGMSPHAIVRAAGPAALLKQAKEFGRYAVSVQPEYVTSGTILDHHTYPSELIVERVGP